MIRGARRALYKQFIDEGGGGVEMACAWKDANKEELKTLKHAPIEMVNTFYGRYEAKQKRNVVRASRKMMLEEREDLRQVINKMDASATSAAAVAAAANRNKPTNITPI